MARLDAEQTGEVRRLTTLLEISQALSSTLDLKTALHRVLETLEQFHGAEQAAVTVLQTGREEISIEASVGLPREGQKARYRVGEGITGRVVQTGKPIIVPQVSKEPLYLGKAGGGRASPQNDQSFVCVPILLNKKAAGALGVSFAFRKDRNFEDAARFLKIVASMIAQALKVHRLVEAERERLLSENSILRQELKARYDFSNIIGTSGPMRQLYEQISQVASTNTTVLIRGESGTGKELFAHAIHYNSPRSKKPFIKVSVAALPETLVESELFGYERGAFTGALIQKKGRFELADGGTLFLDEIGELSGALQVKLLRFLQQREFERVGGTQTLKANVRLITATNRNLEEAIAEGTFREDLFYRLNVFSLFVPPLRERTSDIMLLADHFLARYAQEHGKNIKRIATTAIDVLSSYHWPGNVRELENAIERAVLVCEGNTLHAHHLPPTLQTAETSGTALSVSLDEAVSKFERDLILDALKSTRGNCAKAARLLSSTERIINYKVKKYGLDPARFRGG